MHKLNRIGLTLLVGLLAFPAAAFAQSWSCEHNSLIREVQVERTTAEAAPCQVVYTKETEGFEPAVLWTAQNDAAFCADKAAGLVEKLQGWGWECSESAAAASEAAPMEKADDMAKAVVEEATETASEAKEMVKEAAEEMTEEATETASEAKEMVEEAAEEAEAK